MADWSCGYLPSLHRAHHPIDPVQVLWRVCADVYQSAKEFSEVVFACHLAHCGFWVDFLSTSSSRKSSGIGIDLAKQNLITLFISGFSVLHNWKFTVEGLLNDSW